MTEEQHDKIIFINIVFQELQTATGSDAGSVHLANNYLKELLQIKIK